MMHTHSLRTLALAVSLVFATTAQASGNTWGNKRPVVVPPTPSFALIGDVPYSATQEAQFDNVIAAINADRDVRFVLHNGDVKGGGERCDDAVLQKRFDQYQNFDDAFIVTPGDNDWTDCHRTNNGNYLPTERLEKFRELFYPDPRKTTGGRPFSVRTQADMAGFEPFVENVMWHFNGTVMGTVHVVGSNNNLAPWNQIDPSDSYDSPRADRIAEFQAREAAALAWIDEIFAQATRSRAAGVMIAMQANPNFDLSASDIERQGFNAILDRITNHAIAFAKPVMLAHGDSHYFRIDKPLMGPRTPSGTATLENVTRVENFGSPNVHWVEVFVDPRDPNVFRAEQRLVPENYFPR
ncbi:MAG: hypothetical protein AB1421_10970 [Pseudomonadota bacterium]